MNGPFLADLIALLLSSAVDDEVVGPLVVACLVTARRLAPRCDRVTPAGSLAFAAAVRMVDRVHGDAPIVRALAQPARASGLADGDVLVVEVADLSDGGHAIHHYAARLARRQLQQRVVA